MDPSVRPRSLLADVGQNGNLGPQNHDFEDPKMAILCLHRVANPTFHRTVISPLCEMLGSEFTILGWLTKPQIVNSERS